MFDNVAFEVVIGLVFIYLLYSLLVTLPGKNVSTAHGMRSGLLRLAIERMPNDDFYYHIAKTKKKSINRTQANFSTSLAVDIPILNFHTRPNKPQLSHHLKTKKWKSKITFSSMTMETR